MDTLRVVLAGDRTVVRAGVVALLAADPTVTVVGEAADGREAVELVELLRPDVALLDLRMPVLDGVAATGEIVGGPSGTRVLILTTDDTDTERALEAGAVGCLPGGTTHRQLVQAIHAASRSESRPAPRTRRPTLVTLTAREMDVLNAVADGLSNADIGRRLAIAEAAVKAHLLRVFAKLDVSDRTHAVVTALERGVLAHPE